MTKIYYSSSWTGITTTEEILHKWKPLMNCFSDLVEYHKNIFWINRL